MNKEETISTMLKRSNKCVGCRQVLRGLSEGTIRCVIVAEDADDSIKREIKALAKASGAEVKSVQSMEWLGRSAGIEVRTATVGFYRSEEIV